MVSAVISAASPLSHAADEKGSIQDASPSQDDCRARAGAAIARNVIWNPNDEATPAAAAVVDVRFDPNGRIIARRLLKSSGSRTLDDALVKAVDLTANLPTELKICKLSQVSVAWTP
jgi:colicin import membrane protein